jgi:phosphatidylglycerophosphatase A
MALWGKRFQKLLSKFLPRDLALDFYLSFLVPGEHSWEFRFFGGWPSGRIFLPCFLFSFFTLASVLIAELASPQFNSVDSPHIVIDEVAGYLVTVVWLPRTWQTVVFGFIIFRILDISKPGPIRFIERRLKGGLGIVMDDVVAGIIGNILLQGVYQNTKWLGQI